MMLLDYNEFLNETNESDEYKKILIEKWLKELNLNAEFSSLDVLYTFWWVATEFNERVLGPFFTKEEAQDACEKMNTEAITRTVKENEQKLKTLWPEVAKNTRIRIYFSVIDSSHSLAIDTVFKRAKIYFKNSPEVLKSAQTKASGNKFGL